jgi:hypothetical protein
MHLTGIALIGRARPWTIRHQETTGTPGVVTRTAVGRHGLDKAAAWQDRDRLTLWCEHADQPHPWPPSASPSGQLPMDRTSRHNDGALTWMQASRCRRERVAISLACDHILQGERSVANS